MKPSPSKALTAPIRRVRFVYVAMFLCFWAAAIAVRLGWLQVIDHREYMALAERQQHQTFEIAPRRGMLYDRNLRALAMTVSVDSVYSVPSEVGDNRASDAALLAKVIHQDPDDKFTTEQAILARMMAGKNFSWVARKVDADTAERVKELNLKGIYFQKEFKRFYPKGDLAAHVLGYVGTDDDGLGGLEQQFDDELHGTPGHVLTAIDAKRHRLGSEENDPMPGENLVLAIDSNIQYMAQQALDAQMDKVKALHGTVVVQDPNTGQILALAVSPRFDPNDPRHMAPGALTDLAVSDVYEPGSTFKLVTYSAALDGAGVEPTDIVDCQGGVMEMYGRVFHDDKSDGHMGRVTVQTALEKSSDVGAAKMALKVGPDKFYDYMRAFGFGQRTGIELPSETRGLLRPTRKWSATSILSLAIGQEVGVTPVQLVTMVSTIANGGVYMPPHILLDSTNAMQGDPNFKPIPFRPSYQLPEKMPDGAHRVIKPLTAAKMRAMMQGIVTEGTGKAAQLNGYSSAGKTGTAQKIDPRTHTYSHTMLVASFAGFAPVSSPAISVTVVIDNPTVGSRYGAAVSAPVFHQVAQQVLEYLGVPHDQPVKSEQQMELAEKDASADDVPDGNGADLTAMFDDINSLPADDPLRQQPAAGTQAESAQMEQPMAPTAQKPKDEDISALHATVDPSAATAQVKVEAPQIRPQVESRGNGAVVVDASRRVAVPQFEGAALRSVIQDAGHLGLRVQTLGSGLAKEQAPAAGTMVPVGTEIVVKFGR